MKITFLVLLMVVFIFPIAGQDSLPTFSEMRKFCQKHLATDLGTDQLPPKNESLDEPDIAPSNLNPKKVLEWTKKTMTREAILFQKSLTAIEKRFQRRQKYDYSKHCLQNGYYRVGLEYTGKVVKNLDRQAVHYQSPVYLFYIALYQRYLDQEKKANQYFKQASDLKNKWLLRKRRRQHNHWMKLADDMQAEYERRSFQIHRLLPQFKEAKKNLQKDPTTLKNWLSTKDYAKNLNSKLEELVALKAIENFFPQNPEVKIEEVIRDIAKIYNGSGQPKNALNTTTKAMGKEIISEDILNERVVSFLIMGDITTARKEFARLQKMYPKSRKKYTNIERQVPWYLK